MTSKLTLRLSDVDAEIRAVRTRLSMLVDELGERRREAEERLVRSFIAETPHADREYRVADARCRSLEVWARVEELALASLLAERARLEGEGAPPVRGD